MYDGAVRTYCPPMVNVRNESRIQVERSDVFPVNPPIVRNIFAARANGYHQVQHGYYRGAITARLLCG